MTFINNWTEEEYSLSELVSCLPHEYELKYEFRVFLMDTINGRNDITIVGMTAKEIERMIYKLN